MKKKAGQKKTLISVVLATAILAVTVVLLFTVLGSAGEPVEEIQNFSFQTISGDTHASEDTELRFLFTIGSLDYVRVGFVFSKTKANPTVGGSGCYTFETTSVHSAVWANGDRIEAPDGRYWVAVKMTNIPNASFDDPIYVRAFVQDGSGVRYASPRNLTVCAAFGQTPFCQ